MTLRIAVLVAVLGGCGFHPTLATDGQGSGDDDAQGSGSDHDGSTITGPCGTVGAIRDDFNDNMTSNIWNVVTTGSEVGEMLVVTPTVTTPPMQFMGYLSKHSVDVTGADVTVEVTGMVDTNSQAVGALYLSSDRMNYLSIYERNNNLIVEVGAGTVTAVSMPYDPIQQRWWRIAEAGGMVTFYASPDGVAWNALPGATPTPSWIKRARIALGGSTDGNHGSVSFDNLNQAAMPAGMCKPGVLVDKFQRSMIGNDWDAHVGTGCMPMVSNGARFDQSGMSNSRCWLTSREGFDLTGDHVMAYVPALTGRPSGWQGFLRVVSDNVNDTFLIQYDNQGQLCAQVQSRAEQCITYEAEDTYWRISESGGTLTFDTSADAVAWTPVATDQIVFSVTAVDVEIGTSVTTGFSPPPVNYVLDAYNSGP